MRDRRGTEEGQKRDRRRTGEGQRGREEGQRMDRRGTEEGQRQKRDRRGTEEGQKIPESEEPKGLVVWGLLVHIVEQDNQH